MIRFECCIAKIFCLGLLNMCYDMVRWFGVVLK